MGRSIVRTRSEQVSEALQHTLHRAHSILDTSLRHALKTRWNSKFVAESLPRRENERAQDRASRENRRKDTYLGARVACVNIPISGAARPRAGRRPSGPHLARRPRRGRAETLWAVPRAYLGPFLVRSGVRTVSRDRVTPHFMRSIPRFQTGGSRGRAACARCTAASARTRGRR